MAPDDRDARWLDDDEDREELRSRWYGLLQELRVILPGAQVLLAFLLTAPLSSRFGDLDDPQRAAYAVALVAGLAAVLVLIAPTVFHRVGDRRKRAVRLQWSVRMTVVGTWLLAGALLAALWCVLDFAFGGALSWVVLAGGVVVLGGLWIVLPVLVARGPDDEPADGVD